VRLDVRRGKVRGIELDDGTLIRCNRVIAAIPPGDVCAISQEFERVARAKVAALPQRWGAFVAYCGLPRGVVPTDFATHHQVIAALDAPLGEGTTSFLSFSGEADIKRARGGGRAVTISTHTDVARWERAYRDGTGRALADEYASRLTAALDRVLPGATARAEVLTCATPHTFDRYTARRRGLVGGLPQTPQAAGLRALSHHTPIAGLYLAGDSIFPGQSSVGATLSGLNAARAARHLA